MVELRFDPCEDGMVGIVSVEGVPHCSGVCGCGREGEKVDSFDLSPRTCGGLYGILPSSSDMLEMFSMVVDHSMHSSQNLLLARGHCELY